MFNRRFFSDENHWENGFWERQIVALSKITPDDVANTASDIASRVTQVNII